MSTPFPPNKKLKGLSIYAPPHVRERAASEDPAEIADTSAQTETAQSEAEETEPDPAPDDARPPNEPGTAKDALDWLDDAIREIVELNHVPDGHTEADPSVSASYSPSITPAHDESDDRPPSGARWEDRAESQNVRPRAPRLETQFVPPPLPATRDSGRLGQILRLSLAIVFAAIVAYGVTLVYPSRPDTPRSKDSSDRVAEATPQQTVTQAAPQPPPRLVVEDQQAFANEPVPLAVIVENASGNESLLLDGLAQGTTLSAGTSLTPSSWQLPPDKLAGLYLYAPKDFIGMMNTTVKLLDAGKQLLDSHAMQLKWIAKPPQQMPEPAVASAAKEAPAGVRINSAPPAAPAGVRINPSPPETPAVKPIDPGEAAMLMQRGRDFLATGDISAARVAFGRVANAGMPDAALALANTYDPAYLAAHNFVGVRGDRAEARTLYQRAKDLGSAEAGRILADMGGQ